MPHPSSHWIARAAMCCGLLLAISCSDDGIPPAIECPDGAEPELLRFSENRLEADRREIAAIGWRCFLPNGKFHGPSMGWYANGQLAYITEWSNGLLHGRSQHWYPSGEKKSESHHTYHQSSGVWTLWDREGNVVQARDFGQPAVSAPPDGIAPGKARPELGEAGPMPDEGTPDAAPEAPEPEPSA